MALLKDFKNFQGGGMDSDSALEYVQANDYLAAYNIRVTGTQPGEAGYVSNIESNFLAQPAISPSIGLNKGIGFAGFEPIRQVIGFIANTSGFNQIISLNYDTNQQDLIYLDQTNAASGANLLGLSPTNYVQLRFIDNTYLIWTDGQNEVGYVNLNNLAAGMYSPVLKEDLTLIKPPVLLPPTGVYISDTGRASNFLYGKLFQFNVRLTNAEFNQTAWSTWSKRIIPLQENTPSDGSDVGANNGIIVGVNIGSIRTSQIDIACRYGLFDFNIIKTVTRAYVIALTAAYPDVTNEIYEAYDPASNIYYFVFYNASLQVPISGTETDLLYDNIWPANAIEVVNNNIIAIGDLKVGYPRPTVPVTLQAVGYNANLSVPTTSNPDPLRVSYINPGESGSGEGDHKRLVQINFLGTPNAGDTIRVTLSDIRNTNNTLSYSYTVNGGDTLLSAIQGLSENIPNSSYRQDTASPQVILNIITQPYYGLQSVNITLFNSGATVSKSIHSLLDNSSYQLALLHYDQFGRAFPLDTDNTFIVNTPSYAQVNGQAIQIPWTINQSIAPVGAVTAQWAISPNSTITEGATLLDVLGNMLAYKGTWDAATNTPTLSASSGTVGDTYQISNPNATPTFNLGNGSQIYNTGDYVVYNGQSWDIVPKSFGDLTNTGNIMAIKINPLNLFNQLYSNNGKSTVLTYDFSQNDRCTLHSYFTGSTENYINFPCIDVQVFGYDASTFLLKVEKSAALVYSGGNISYNGTNINGDNIYLRLYSPATQQSNSTTTTDNTTIFSEIGEVITIVNGQYSVTTGVITDGDVYYKTRQYQGAVNPNTAYPVLATDFNFSDFYPSAFTSYGRPRSFYDQLEQSEQKATIITSQPYVIGSRINGLNRFYPADVYGDSDGQTSSSYGAIQVLWQRNDVLIVLQERKVGYIPVNIAYVQLNAATAQEAISETLFNNIRYNQTGDIGIGLSKESFASYNNSGFFVDPNRSEPMQININGVFPISRKLSKYFKKTLQQAYANGYKMMGYYDTFNNEYVLSIQLPGNTLINLPFSTANWNPNDNYNITPSEIITLGNGMHSSASYDITTGIATFIPASGYVGNDSASFSFSASGTVVKNICLQWTAGNSTPFNFSFTPLTGQPLDTLFYSNTISVQGINIASPISVTGAGGYSLNGAPYTTSPGTVVNGDVVQVSNLSSSSNNTETTTTLTIGGVSASFNVTTQASAPSASINSNNLTSDFTIAYVKVYNGGTLVYSQTNIGPNSFYYSALTAGTYTVDVKIFPSTDGGTGTLKISSNGVVTSYAVSSFGLTMTQSATTNIIVELDPA